MQKSIALIVTTRCNFKCKHCLREYYTKQYDLPLDILKKALKDAKKIGFLHTGITGGEPILHPKFNDMIDIICDLGYTWSVTTNASMCKRYDFSIDKHKDSLKSIRISLDGGTEETHDYIRRKGSFKEVVAGSKHFKSKGIKLLLGLTINSRNINEVPQFIKLAQKLKADGIGFGAIIPTGYNLNLQPTWEQKMQVYKYILELRKTSKIKIATTSSLYAPTGADEFCKNINEHKPAINSYGDYIFCCDTIGRGAVLGSLKKESFSKLFKKGEEKALWLKEERRKRILSKDFFTGFNSCHFCNLLLEKQIIKQKEYQTENKNLSIIKSEEISLEDRLKKII